MTNQERCKKGQRVNEFAKRSFLVGNPIPELGEIINTAFGQYVVIAQNWGGDGWIRCAPLDKITVEGGAL